jgi:hypothetical protein
MARELVYSVDAVAAIAISSRVLFVTAIGKTRTSGWKNPSLDPRVYIMPPADGYQEFEFRATPPTGPVLQVLTPIAAEYVWTNPPRWVKGVRVYAETNKKNAKVIRLGSALQAKAAPKKAAAAKSTAKKKPAAKKTAKKAGKK